MAEETRFSATQLHYGYVLNHDGETCAKTGLVNLMDAVRFKISEWEKFINQHDVGDFEIHMTLATQSKKNLENSTPQT